MERDIFLKLESKEDNRWKLATLFRKFENMILPELRELKREESTKNKNIYQLANADSLSVSNAITRTFSTKLGTLWEEIAMLSPVVISPQYELGYRIPEVDIIVNYNNKLYYTQLKTQKNTLTGTQAPRTKDELSVYENSWFVACVDTNCQWTASPELTRLVGEEFWSKIGIDYSEIVENLKETIRKVEEIARN